MIIKLIKIIINKLFICSHNIIITREPYISYYDNSVISDVITIVRIESYSDIKEYILPFRV
jgi:hypothetical protein